MVSHGHVPYVPIAPGLDLQVTRAGLSIGIDVDVRFIVSLIQLSGNEI